MDVLRAKNESHWIKQINEWVEAHMASFDSPLVHLPAGDTPASLYAEWDEHRPEFLNKARFQQVDDIVTGSQKGLFQRFFQKSLPSYGEQFHPLGDEPLASQVAILGVGLNGHIAFHEPHIPLNFNYGCVPLAEKTKAHLHMQGPVWGLTYGVGHFIKTNAVLVLARGEAKTEIIQKILTGSSEALPVAELAKKGKVTLMISDEIRI
ncbi:MAG: 6-phosphogluconolactonase [Pseudobdellovibrionaceae bacterium]|nr:6-phosphogluconolactonase [Bdellovibrionales bacterium]USN48486.1 MAG: 6-phosphogluconolactonase [Pseudobdellovibrionaceae bacterium]